MPARAGHRRCAAIVLFQSQAGQSTPARIGVAAASALSHGLDDAAVIDEACVPSRASLSRLTDGQTTRGS